MNHHCEFTIYACSFKMDCKKINYYSELQILEPVLRRGVYKY